MSCRIYVLKCDKGKFYIGKTYRDIEQRFKEHLTSSKCSSWTFKYKPIEIFKVYEGPHITNYDEDKYVKMYMDKYGIENVRGGSYSKITLDPYTLQHLHKEIRGANDQCFLCGSSTHFAKHCKESGFTPPPSPPSSPPSSPPPSSSPPSSPPPPPKTKKEHRYFCKRCKRYGHTQLLCKATCDNNNEPIKRPCLRCQRMSHSIEHCYAKKHLDGHLLTQQSKHYCFRCGRQDHGKLTCIEEKDIYGIPLKSHPIGWMGSIITNWFKNY